MDIKIIYNKYSLDGNLVGEKEYTVTSKEDYNRAMRIIEENPDEYELVNCGYGFLERSGKMENRSFATEARAMSGVIETLYSEREFLKKTLKGLDGTAEIAIKKRAQLQMVEHLIKLYEAY